MILKRIEKFLSGFRKYLFYYKDGFFELPFMANSPETIVKSLTGMPFVKHYEQKQKFSSNTPFLNADIYYQEIEQGLWILFADAKYKTNVHYKLIVDKELPSDYYMLGLEISATEIKAKPGLVNGFSFSSFSWLLYKPNENLNHCRFKGSRALSLSIYFSEKWLREVLYKEQHFLNSQLKHFFESDARYIMWPETPEAAGRICDPIHGTYNKPGGSKVPDFSNLKQKAHDFIFHFVDRYNTDDIGKNFFEISDSDRIKIFKAERLIVEYLNAPFMGIENLSGSVGISPTKLKSDFKLVFGETVFQYFRQKQMEYARSVLQEDKISVKAIAHELGYENTSKFTAAFKKHMGILPSEVK
jgi:AraC-like DNA-binding protein